MIDNFQDFLKNPGFLLISMGARGFFNYMDDEKYLKLVYRIRMKKKLHLNPPITYNEKLQWLKLHDRNPMYSTMVDKYEAKKYVTDRIGEEYIIPTIGVWDNFDDIDFKMLPNQFVLKCTHDSGGLIICKDKENLNTKKARRRMTSCLKHSYYWGEREWPYKNIKPRIIAEEYIEDAKTKELRDYKFFAFDGKVRALFIASDRQKQEETKFDFFDSDFNHLNLRNGHPNAIVPPEKPEQFDQMIKLAGILSKGIPQLRVDFYEVNEKVYFGELTFSHWSGMMPFEPEKWDKVFGDWIDLK